MIDPNSKIVVKFEKVPKELVDFIKSYGVEVDDLPKTGGMMRYLNLPQWLVENDAGEVFMYPMGTYPKEVEYYILKKGEDKMYNQ
jgi:hypothetical protein